MSNVVIANEVPFICKSSNESIKLQGFFTTENSTVKFFDTKNSLNIKELEIGESVIFERTSRKQENKYSFAKFYSDFNAWQGIELSLPKTILTGIEKGLFTTFLTVYVDNGDLMVPGESSKLSCETR
jgi:hypothetical protein